MQVDLFGNQVRCETDGVMISLNDIERAGNAWRLSRGMPAYQLTTFLNTVLLREYIQAASQVWDIPEDRFLTKAGKGKTSRTMGHVSVALLLAEQMSPFLHATIHKVFIEGKLLEFRDYGASEYKNLNAEIDTCMVQWEGRHAHQGHFIQVAKALNSRLLDPEQTWDSATVVQTHKRYETEAFLCKALRCGVIQSWEHLKEVINRT